MATANETIDWPSQQVIVTGGAGFMGGRVCELLRERGVPEDHIFVPRRRAYDLTEKNDCARLYREAFGGEPATMVLHLAAEVGGIGANRANPGRYFYANMAMAMHLMEQARVAGFVEHGGTFVQVGSICSYPKFTPVPFQEEEFWNGYPEETNAPYGVAKKAAWQMLDAYRLQYGMRGAFVLPVNLYGPRDNFNLETSHVIPALIRKCIEAKEAGREHIEVWGTGSASREFLYVDDAASGVLTAAERMDDPTPINLGTNSEVSIRTLVEMIAQLTGFAEPETLERRIKWDTSKPDGQPRRCLDVTRAKEMLGWEARVDLEEGLRRTIDWFLEHRSDVDARL